jgi:hypothetical protein
MLLPDGPESSAAGILQWRRLDRSVSESAMMRQPTINPSIGLGQAYSAMAHLPKEEFMTGNAKRASALWLELRTHPLTRTVEMTVLQACPTRLERVMNLDGNTPRSHKVCS